jgi:hypothetical protein
MQFKFRDDSHYASGSGYLAFTTATATSTMGDGSINTRPLLLVTDAGHDAVHLVDVVGRAHAGYVASPGSIAGPRGVAASGASPLVAVSAWKKGGSGDHVVVVYQGTGGGAWEVARVIGGGFGGPGSRDGQLHKPVGLRFSGDGSGICVADFHNNRASMFRVSDGGFVEHFVTGLTEGGPIDVEEAGDGWLVACSRTHTVELVVYWIPDDDDGWLNLGGDLSRPVALAVVPGLGLVVREYGNGGRLQVFATPDAMAMASMSPARVSWMCAVARAALCDVAGSLTHAHRAGHAKRIHLAVGEKGGSL